MMYNTQSMGRDGSIDSSLLSNDDRQRTAIVRLTEPELGRTQPRVEQVESLRENANRTQESVRRFARGRADVSIRNSFWITNAVVVEVRSDRALRELARVRGVERVHENTEFHIFNNGSSRGTADSEDDDVGPTHDDYTYGLEQINIPDVWDEHGIQGGGARVAVLDTGIDNDHPDLELYTEDSTDPTYPGGWAEIDSDGNIVEGSEPHDTGEHGTHVSGTVAGGDASGTHIGVAPNVELMHGLVLPGGSGT